MDTMEQLLQQRMPKRKGHIYPREEFSVYTERLTSIGKFTTRQFLQDLKELYFAVKTYHAIMAMQEGDSAPAEALAKDGRETDGMFALSRDITEGRKTFAESVNEFCYLCRPLKMELSYNARWKEFVYAPVLDSVFDIAWFALYRIAVSGARSAVEDKRTFRTIQCRACRRTVVANGNNQLYCDDAECQAFKKAKNQRERRARIKKDIK